MAQLIKPPRRAHAEVATLVAGISLIASCSTGTGTGSDRFKKSPDNQPTNTKVPPIELDAASETQDLCNDPASVSKPYRGVNLTGLTMVAYGQVNGYAESDFSLLHDLGFNWARLPIDYLNYTEEGDWLRYSRWIEQDRSGSRVRVPICNPCLFESLRSTRVQRRHEHRPQRFESVERRRRAASICNSLANVRPQVCQCARG